MTTQPDTSQERRLRSLRLFLLVCFLAGSLAGSLLGTAPLMLFGASSHSLTVRIFNVPLSNQQFSLPALAFLTCAVLIGLAGAACLTAYYVLKARIEREEATDLEADCDETAD